MPVFTMKEAKNRLTELARMVERGERVVITRHGKDVMELVQPKKKGLDLEAGQRWLRARGITDPFPYIAPDFDDPLPEDFLITPNGDTPKGYAKLKKKWAAKEAKASREAKRATEAKKPAPKRAAALKKAPNPARRGPKKR